MHVALTWNFEHWMAISAKVAAYIASGCGSRDQVAFLQWHSYVLSQNFRLKTSKNEMHGKTWMQQFWKQICAINKILPTMCNRLYVRFWCNWCVVADHDIMKSQHMQLDNTKDNMVDTEVSSSFYCLQPVMWAIHWTIKQKKRIGQDFWLADKRIDSSCFCFSGESGLVSRRIAK